jgi:hypothetical protein
MYYTDKSDTFNDKMYNLGTYKNRPNYIADKIVLKDYKYKSNNDFENELFKINEEELVINPVILEHKIQYVSSIHNPIKLVYNEDRVKYRQYGDIEFYNWLYLQTDPTIGVLAEIINAPKLNNKIEKMRDKVDTLETVSIANFAKHKKIGARQNHFIKKIKDKYGNNILKFLNLYM